MKVKSNSIFSVSSHLCSTRRYACLKYIDARSSHYIKRFRKNPSKEIVYDKKRVMKFNGCCSLGGVIAEDMLE